MLQEGMAERRRRLHAAIVRPGVGIALAGCTVGGGPAHACQSAFLPSTPHFTPIRAPIWKPGPIYSCTPASVPELRSSSSSPGEMLTIRSEFLDYEAQLHSHRRARTLARHVTGFPPQSHQYRHGRFRNQPADLS